MILAEHDVSAWDDKGVRDSGDETKRAGHATAFLCETNDAANDSFGHNFC